MENAEAAYVCLQDIPPENGLKNDAYGHSYQQFLQEDLPAMLNQAAGVALPEGWVPQTCYVLMDGDAVVGYIKLRHYLTEAIANGAGHISYGICRSVRGRGYATAGLSLAVQTARQLIPEGEIYMNVNKDNPASLRVMLKCGAYIHHESDGEYYTRIPLGKERSP